MAEDVHSWDAETNLLGERRFVLRWNALNFNAPVVSCTVPRRLIDAAADMTVAFDGLTVRYNGAAPGVVLSRIIVYSHKETGVTYATTVGSLTTATADQTLLVPLYGLPFMRSPAWTITDLLVSILASGYAATDDINVCMWGRVSSTQRAQQPGDPVPAQPVTVDGIRWPLRRVL